MTIVRGRSLESEVEVSLDGDSENTILLLVCQQVK
ncbi:hypothetical protein HNQ54_003525 [Anaerocolumna cellulosilytica]|nr:hypothetical protein [Anaerocolumna cellulosilytica]